MAAFAASFTRGSEAIASRMSSFHMVNERFASRSATKADWSRRSGVTFALIGAPTSAVTPTMAVDEVRQSQRGIYETYVRLTVKTERQFAFTKPRNWKILPTSSVSVQSGLASPSPSVVSAGRTAVAAAGSV